MSQLVMRATGNNIFFMNEILCVDETLDINSTSLYNLSIQVSLDGFCFSIFNSVNKKYIVLKYIPYPNNISNEVIFEKIEETLKKEELLNLTYKSVNAIYLSPKYTLVPEEFFDVESHRSLFMNTVDAITLGDELIKVRTKRPINRSLGKVTTGQKLFWRFITSILLPAIIMTTGSIYIMLRKKQKFRID